jgi:hypothetical protein
MPNIEFTRDQLNKLGYYNKQKQIDFDEETIRAIFGHEAAEDESTGRLKEYYVKTEIYNSMKSSIPLYIVVGHKGVGKSALLKVLQIEDAEVDNIPILVQPDDIVDLNINNDNFLQRIRDWKDGLSKIIFNKLILSVNNSIISASKNATLKSWIDKFGELVFTVVGKKLSDLQGEYLNIPSSQFTILFKNTLFKEKKITIYLDDLDRGWKSSTNDVQNLSAMLNAIRDLSRDTNNLFFRVALRSDVYYAIRTSDETTDKIDGSVLWQRWTNHEILVMLIKRIETFLGHAVYEEFLLSRTPHQLQDYLSSVFASHFSGKGHWNKAPMYRVLMSLIRKRPRDLVKLCTLSARKAYNNHHHLILTNDLESIFSNYSNDRLTDTGNEYISELPRVKELLLKMKPSQKEMIKSNPCLFSRSELLTKLENILSMSNFSFKDGKDVTPQSLAAFLYKINFLTARKDISDGIQRIYYDENQYIYNEFADFGYSYEIHPAYRWALQPTMTNDLFNQIQLSE